MGDRLGHTAEQSNERLSREAEAGQEAGGVGGPRRDAGSQTGERARDQFSRGSDQARDEAQRNRGGKGPRADKRGRDGDKGAGDRAGSSFDR